MNRLATTAAILVGLNFAVNAAHGLSHAHQQVDLLPWQTVYVAIVVLLAPIVAAFFYRTSYRRWGAAVLTTSMLGSVLFGIYFHFIAETSDHVSHRPADLAGRFFVWSAVLLIPVGLAGAGFGIWSWQKLGQAQS